MRICKCGRRMHHQAKVCKDCYHKLRRKLIIGINNPNWKGGNKCKNCGKHKVDYKSNLCRSCYIKSLQIKSNNSFYKHKHTTKSKEKISLSKIGNRHYNWKGGRVYDSHGYILLYNPRHPNCNYNGYVFEHRLIIEKYLGRYLKPKEIIHHKNGIRDDNRLKNLRIFNNHSEHATYHIKLRNRIIFFLRARVYFVNRLNLGNMKKASDYFPKFLGFLSTLALRYKLKDKKC